MPIKSEEYSQVCVIEVHEALLGPAVADAKKAIEERIDQRQIVDFVIDFQKCEFIDSEGLEGLLWIKRRCEELFGRLKLVSLDENCKKILEITRLAHDFESQADLATALKTMR